MRITKSEKLEFVRHIIELLEQEQVETMKHYIQHGNTSTYMHCLVVAYYSYLLALRLPLQFDTKSIARGAMLHDFYLYDWHIPDQSHRLHGYVHPRYALRNAKKYFKLNPIEEDIIEKHMWPLTFRKFPAHKEALLVNVVDKLCSLGETFYLPVLPKDIKLLNHMLTSKKPEY